MKAFAVVGCRGCVFESQASEDLGRTIVTNTKN